MESKTARLTILVDPAKKRAFERLCAAQDLTPSQVVRQLIREYLTAHGVTWETRSVVPGAGAPNSRAQTKDRSRKTGARRRRRG